jgi:DNA-binding response OmpR family regulator
MGRRADGGGGLMVTVLLTDDDADIRDLVTFKLREVGYEVRAFGDGLSALASARDNRPDLALLDIVMPGVSGLDVCRELKANPATSQVPIILLTARAQQSDIETCFAAGADDYIVKPFSPRELASRVNAVLARIQA